MGVVVGCGHGWVMDWVCDGYVVSMLAGVGGLWWLGWGGGWVGGGHCGWMVGVGGGGGQVVGMMCGWWWACWGGGGWGGRVVGMVGGGRGAWWWVDGGDGSMEGVVWGHYLDSKCHCGHKGQSMFDCNIADAFPWMGCGVLTGMEELMRENTIW